VEWAHAIAPLANILLVEARSASITDLLTAVNYARNIPGVTAVSMSWGTPEFLTEGSLQSYFTTPAGHIGGGMGRTGGVTFVASAGDNGAGSGPQWPAVSPNVLAVGGTSLYLSPTGAYSTESGWSGSGGGYSKYVSEPTFQGGVQSTGKRSNPDVAYNANPNTGVYVFNSFSLPSGYSGWWSFGGTSAGAPQWAALIALANDGRARYGLGSMANAQATVYALPASDFHVVVGGSNGYAVTSGYNPVTGRGSPYANLVVWGLISAGSATLTVGTTPTGKPTGATGTSTKHATGAPIGGEAPPVVSGSSAAANPFAFVFQSGPAPFLPSPAQTTDALFARQSGTGWFTAPVATATDDLLHDLVRSFQIYTTDDETPTGGTSLFDLGSFETDD
jgi:subtilase family serine protease